MIGNPSITIALKFSQEELVEIYGMMRDINIMDYPSNFKEYSNIRRKPFETYRITIQIGEKQKVIFWEDEQASKTEKANKLRNLFKKIHEVISLKEEYKSLPLPKGGYA
jgi:hypothetical protein